MGSSHPAWHDVTGLRVKLDLMELYDVEACQVISTLRAGLVVGSGRQEECRQLGRVMSLPGATGYRLGL